MLAQAYFSMIRAKRVRLIVTHKYCPHCQKDCNVKTYKEHRRLFFNLDKKSWYVASTSEQTAIESDVESLDSFLASEDHDSSDGDLSMFEETEEDVARSTVFHHEGEFYSGYSDVVLVLCS